MLFYVAPFFYMDIRYIFNTRTGDDNSDSLQI